MVGRDVRVLLREQWREDRHLCVGLDDEDAGKMRRVVDLTHPFAAAYKINWSFHLPRLEAGVVALRSLIRYIQGSCSAPVILDCKYGDIGSSSSAFLRMVEQLDPDAITVSPYLGQDAVQPFLDVPELGVFVLCRTSNPGARTFQDLLWSEAPEQVSRCLTPSKPKLFHKVAFEIDREWNKWGNCGLVVGATYPGELADVRKLAPERPLLIPGVGAQGGDLKAAVEAARYRFLVSVSRGIIGAEDPGKAAEELHLQIISYLPA